MMPGANGVVVTGDSTDWQGPCFDFYRVYGQQVKALVRRSMIMCKVF